MSVHRAIACGAAVAALLVAAAGCGDGGGVTGPGTTGTAPGTSATAGTTDGTDPSVLAQARELVPDAPDLPCALTLGTPDAVTALDAGAAPAAVEPPDRVVATSASVQQGFGSGDDHWFVVGEQALVRFDPLSGDPAEVLVAPDDCHLRAAAVGGGSVATIGCDAPFDRQPTTCTVSVLERTGSEPDLVGAWAVPVSGTLSSLSWPDGSDTLIVATQRSDGRPWIAAFATDRDSATVIDDAGSCEPTTVQQVIAHTSLVRLVCNGADGQDSVIVDGVTGELRWRGDYQSLRTRYTSGGERVWTLGGPVRDASTFSEVGPPVVAASVLDGLLSDPLPLDVIDRPDALWVLQCVEPCTPQSTVTVELALVDPTTGEVLDRWSVEDTLVSRETRPTRVALLTADADGAWFTVDGILHRAVAT